MFLIFFVLSDDSYLESSRFPLQFDSLDSK